MDNAALQRLLGDAAPWILSRSAASSDRQKDADKDAVVTTKPSEVRSKVKERRLEGGDVHETCNGEEVREAAVRNENREKRAEDEIGEGDRVRKSRNDNDGPGGMKGGRRSAWDERPQTKVSERRIRRPFVAASAMESGSI